MSLCTEHLWHLTLCCFSLGETMVIAAKVDNSSSKDMTPKFTLIQDVLYLANSSTKHKSNVIFRMAGKGIKPQTQEELKCEVKIPCDQKPTIQNCDIIKVEYHLKSYFHLIL
uniref:Arrestin C-terminal-like domain-containing protein n=1 Tax=Monopterus albus TaxID=43700 RepID=A0A3Q3QGT7_MONAL